MAAVEMELLVQGGIQGALVAVRQSSFFICGALRTIGYATHRMHKNKLLSS